MERRGSITPGMRAAGDDFRTTFRQAHLDPLRAASLVWESPGQSEGAGLVITRIRQRVCQAIDAVGGMSSPAGSCIWHVVGFELPLKRWALEQAWRAKPLDQETAYGILVAGLGALEAHYAGLLRRPVSHRQTTVSDAAARFGSKKAV